MTATTGPNPAGPNPTIPPDQIPPDQILPDQILPDQILPDQIPPDQIPPDQITTGPNPARQNPAGPNHNQRLSRPSRLNQPVSLTVGGILFYLLQLLIPAGFFLLFHYSVMTGWNALILCFFILVAVNCSKLFTVLIDKLSNEAYMLLLSYGLVALLGVNIYLVYKVRDAVKHGNTATPAKIVKNDLLMQLGAPIEGQICTSAIECKKALEDKLNNQTPVAQLDINTALKNIFDSAVPGQKMKAPRKFSLSALKKNKGKPTTGDALSGAQVLDFLLRNFYGYTKKLLEGKAPPLIIKIKNNDNEDEMIIIYSLMNRLIISPSSRLKIKGYAPLIFQS